MTYRVTADIAYLDGPLAGQHISDGHDVTQPTKVAAMRVVRWLQRVRREHDFIRASMTGHRYYVRGNIQLHYRPTPIEGDRK
jgi:hypothetical protein